LRERAQGDARLERQARKISEQVALAASLAGELLDAAKDRPLRLAPCALPGLLESALGQVTVPPGGTLAREVPEGLPSVLVDRARLRQALVVLLQNALDALGGRGALRIGAEARAG